MDQIGRIIRQRGILTLAAEFAVATIGVFGVPVALTFADVFFN